MLRSVRVRNFRSIADSKDLRLTQLNMFVGPNNAGKSSLLHALLLIKQTCETETTGADLVTSGRTIDLGSYLSFIRGHDPAVNLGLDFALDVPLPAALRKRLNAAGGDASLLSWSTEFGYDQATDAVRLRGVTIGGRRGNVIVESQTGTGGVVYNLPEEVRDYFTCGFRHFCPTVILKRRPPRDRDRSAFDVFAVYYDLQRHLSENFARLMYVGPVRQRIPRMARRGTMPEESLGPSGENLMRALLVGGRSGTSAKYLLAQLERWLGKRFRLVTNLRVEALDRSRSIFALMGDDPRGHGSINLAEMGCGVSQLVPVIVQTVSLPAKGCLLVEQPEVHLHPAAEAELADLFIANLDKQRQFIIETHSEHLILRVRRRIAEGRLRPDQAAVFMTYKHGGQTRFKRLSLKDNGHFTKWPRGFFEEGYKEALAIAEATLR